MLPSNINDYKQMCALLHYFFSERYYSSEYAHPSRADQFVSSGKNYLAGYTSVTDANGLMDYWVQKHFPALVQDFNGQPPRPTFPLIKNIVSSKAVSFKETVQIDMVDAVTGKTLTGEDLPIAGLLQKRLRDTGWFSMMRDKETMAVLYQTAASFYRIIDGELVMTALAPFAFDAEAAWYDPSNPMRAKAFSVPKYGMSYVSDPSAEDAYVYTREKTENGPVYVGALVDREGVVVETLEGVQDGVVGPLPPVVIWKESTSNILYSAPPLALYNAQVDLLLELVASTVAVRTGAHGTIAVGKAAQGAADFPREMGMDPLGARAAAAAAGNGEMPQPIRIAGNPNSIMRIPDGWEAQVLQSRVDPEVYAKWVQGKIKLAYIGADMPPGMFDIINPPPSNVSGKARYQEQMPRILAKQRREPHVKEQAVADLRVWAQMWNHIAPESEKIPLDRVDFRVNFSEIWSPDALADQSVVQALSGAAELGLLDLVKTRMQIDGTTMEEARESFWASVGTFKGSKKDLA